MKLVIFIFCLLFSNKSFSNTYGNGAYDLSYLSDADVCMPLYLDPMSDVEEDDPNFRVCYKLEDQNNIVRCVENFQASSVDCISIEVDYFKEVLSDNLVTLLKRSNEMGVDVFGLVGRVFEDQSGSDFDIVEVLDSGSSVLSETSRLTDIDPPLLSSVGVEDIDMAKQVIFGAAEFTGGITVGGISTFYYRILSTPTRIHVVKKLSPLAMGVRAVGSLFSVTAWFRRIAKIATLFSVVAPGARIFYILRGEDPGNFALKTLTLDGYELLTKE